MTLARPQGAQAAADLIARRVVLQSIERAARRWATNGVIAVGMLALLGTASSASAVILTGGPSDTLPGGGGCSVTGIASRSGGAIISCTGVNLGLHTHVYFGIRNDANVNGNTMTGGAPGSGSGQVFRFSSSTSSTITYTSSTTVTDEINGTQPVTSRLLLTLTAGTGSVVSAGGNPANNANGDIQSLFQITGGTTFTVRADVQASDPFFGLGNACPAVYDPSHASTGNGGDVSKVDVAFYRSDCGDSVVDSPEQCDAGAANGTPGSCCTSACQFRASGQICRPGAGAPCDVAETCTGISPTCPADDAPLNMGNVCRAGSGDICDQNELCTGTPGAGCPADDAPGNMGLLCRAGSVGDICNESELCTGAPGGTCPPDDSPSKINVVCRVGSGDVCDPDERCTGLIGQGCPLDAVSNPSTVCRVGSGDTCDPNETCTAVPGQPCPADVVTPSGTQCRAAVGACDLAEVCTGNAGQTCPANGFTASGTPCNVDNNVCTVDECNGSGSCTFDSNLDCEDGNTCTQDSCDPQNGCESVGQPAMNCVGSSKAILKIKNNLTEDVKDSIKLIWKGGPALVPNMGDPVSPNSTRYELCVYDATGVQMAMGVPSGAGWQTVGSPGSPKGYKYSDLLATQNGIRQIKLKGSNLNKGQAKVAGKGFALPDTQTMPFQYPVTAQLYASDGMCWNAQFDQPHTKKNTSTGYTAKTP